MKISFDGEADALYIELASGKFHTNKRIDDDTVLDLDADGKVIGIEMIGVRDKISTDGVLKLSVHVQQDKAHKPIIENLEIPISA